MLKKLNVGNYYDKHLGICSSCKKLISDEDDYVILWGSFRTKKGNWFNRNFGVQKRIGYLHRDCFVDMFIGNEIGD